MNLKEVSELRRRFRMDRNAISRIYGCFVNSSREIVSYIDESMGILPQDEAEKYLNLLKKTLSGKLGKNLIDIIFSTEQVADSDEHRLLMALRDSQLKDGDIREEFYQKIINSLDLGDSNYLILLAHDTYDVPHKNKNDEMDADTSDAVFSYVVCCVCPVKERKAELGFFPGDNEFHSCAGQIVAAPELGFVFPAFDDRAANIYNALFYSRKADEIHQEVIDSVFHTTAPMSAAEQKEAFQNALSEALGDACNMELVQSIHDRLRDQIEQHMMYRKALSFGDEKVATQILATDNAAEIKALGRLVSGYDESLWNGIRQIVVYEGLFAKFTQNPDLRERLKDTGNAFLAECAVNDWIWGIGLSMRDPSRLDRAKWQGQNLLGYALMMVREKL